MALDERHSIPDVPSPPYIGFTERSTIQPSENPEEQESNHFEVPPVLKKTLSFTSARGEGEEETKAGKEETGRGRDGEVYLLCRRKRRTKRFYQI